MQIQKAVKYTAEILTPFSDEAFTEARLIVAYLAGTEPNRLTLCDADIDRERIDEIAEKRRQGIPLQYIFGKWWFYKSEFLVGKGVLIPRQDTELLVETGLELAKNIKSPKICDLCSGSGCIAISLAKELADAEVTAVEKYDGAYKFLLKNIKHNSADNVKAVKADVTKESFGKFDLIVSNPPYIPEGDLKDLSREVLNEPHTALFGGEDGLYFYRVIAKNWKNTLSFGGVLAFEVGIKEADEVAEILKDEGFENISFKYDLIGIQRVVFGTANNIK